MTATETSGAAFLDGLRFGGRQAVITGAGRGIGRGCALAFAELGASVVGVSRTASELEELGEQIAGQGGTFRGRPADVTRIEEVEEVIGGLGRVDVLVNCAGGNIPEPFLDVSAEQLRFLVELNLVSTFLVSQTVSRRMAESNSGAIVNLSSQMGHVGAPGRTVYCATKHAVEGLTKAMAVELAPLGIRVNAVAPTFIETPMTEGFFRDADFRRATEDQIPLGRIGEVSDVVAAVVYLASSAASLVTGTSLLVDGGWTAR